LESLYCRNEFKDKTLGNQEIFLTKGMQSRRFKNLKISEETKKLTNKCHCDFHCLDGGDICSVFIKLQGNLLIKDPVQEAKCRYQSKYGSKSLYCNCPIRYETHLKYGL
jgi:hypothetical protein